jgi:hypothetical protein
MVDGTHTSWYRHILSIGNSYTTSPYNRYLGTPGIGTRYSMVLCHIVCYVNSNPTGPGPLQHANFKSVNRLKIGKPENSFWSPPWRMYSTDPTFHNNWYHLVPMEKNCKNLPYKFLIYVFWNKRIRAQKGSKVTGRCFFFLISDIY